MSKYLFVIVFILFHFMSFTQNVRIKSDGWDWMNPLAFGGLYRNMHFVDGQNQFICGDYGTIIYTRNGGTDWTQSTVPEGFFKPIDQIVFSKDGSKGYALYSDSLLESSDSGHTWKKVTNLPVPSIAHNWEQLEVYEDTVLLFSGVWNSGSWTDELVKKHVNDTNWVQVSKSAAQHSYMAFPYYITKDNIRDSVSILANQLYNDLIPLNATLIPGTKDMAFLFKRDLGGSTMIYSMGYFNSSTKEITYLTNQITTNIPLRDIFSINDTLIYVTGDNIYRVNPQKRTFEDLGNTGKPLNKIHFDDINNGWIASANFLTLYQTINAGNFWVKSKEYKRTNDFDKIRGLYFRNRHTGYMFIETKETKYEVLKTDDGGANWQPLFENIIQEQVNDFKKLWVNDDESKAFVLSSNILFNHDSMVYTYPDFYDNQVNDFYFLNSDTGWYIDQKRGTPDTKIFGTSNGGNSWNELYTFTNTELLTLYFTSGQEGYVGGTQGKILKTSDGGTSWNDISVAGVNVNGLQFLDKDTGFVAGDNGVFFLTHDGGSTWIPRNTGTNDNLHALTFFNGQVGYILTSKGLIKSIDAGQSFTAFEVPLDLEVGFSQKTPGLAAVTEDFSKLIYARDSMILTIGDYTPDPGTPVGMSVNEMDAFRIYPNPASQLFLIQGIIGRFQLNWYDLIGKKLHSEFSEGQNSIKVPDICSGIYLLEIIQGDYRSVQKVIVE